MPWFQAHEKGSGGERGNLPDWATSPSGDPNARPLVQRGINLTSVSATSVFTDCRSAFRGSSEIG
jgi:hypothetical protein